METGIPGGGPGVAAAERPDLVPLDCLGEGSYGVVYRARDLRSGAQVAIKILRQSKPDAIARFKREFRTLADIHHPNLVSLHHLFGGDDGWMFSMEYVDGVHLLRWVNCGTRAFQAGGRVASTLEPDPAPLRHARLRDAVRQVADGLAALHGNGHLHRDLKPSNILVTPEARAVLLDFGLVGDLQSTLHRQPADTAGSPAYMSPEQSVGAPATEASDWYSVGVVLFEALTGRLPFGGPSKVLLGRKQSVDAPDVRAHAPDAPDDLVGLCNDLLRRRADLRPRGDEVRARLAPNAGLPPSASTWHEGSLVGREEQLAVLEDARRRVGEDRQPILVAVTGEPGMGKSALLRQFAVRAAGQHSVVLAGRCYEQETVPYKGMDGVIDALAQYLQTLSADEVARVVSDDVGLLARVFPVLGQVAAIARAAPSSAPADPQALRDATFMQLASVLRRLADRRPVTVIVDDAHWGDRDSADLVRRLVTAEPRLSILWVLAHHDDTRRSSPMVQALTDSADRADLTKLDIALAPLAEEEARAVAATRLGTPPGSGLCETIARESGGMPLFLVQLAEHARATGKAEGTSLRALLSNRLSRLPAPARRYLEAAAIFARPAPAALTARAARCEDAQADAVTVLRAGRLLRMVASPTGAARVETYHDRVRELVVQTLSPERRQALHHAWVGTLLGSGSADAEDLAVHLEGAGDAAGAAAALARAAERASHSLAWDRAARLYGRALALAGRAGGERRSDWRAGRARALANAGRGAEAAAAFLSLAADRTAGAQRMELQREAAEQLLRSGRMDEGFAVLGEVLRAADVPFPKGPAQALAGAARERLRLRLRGTRFEERPPEGVPAEQLLRIDACLSAGVGLSGVDSLRAAFFQSRALRLALDAGEPRRVARALAFEAAFQSNRGRRGQARAEALVASTRELVERLDDPYLRGLTHGAQAVGAFHVGAWQRCVDEAQRAEALFRDRCTGAAKETVTVRLFALAAWTQLGRFADLDRWIPLWLADAERRGDVYASMNLRTGLPNMVWLAHDEPDEASRQAAEAMVDWKAGGFLIPDFFDLLARTEADVYAGDVCAARKRLADSRAAVRASLLPLIQVLRVLHCDLWGRTHLAAYARAPQSRALTRAERCGRALTREGVCWAEALGFRLLAGVAAARGKRRRAEMLLATARHRFARSGMAAHAATAQLGLAELAGTIRRGDEAERATAELTRLGVRRPERFLRLHLPNPMRPAGRLRLTWPWPPARTPAHAGTSPRAD